MARGLYMLLLADGVPVYHNSVTAVLRQMKVVAISCQTA